MCRVFALFRNRSNYDQNTTYSGSCRRPGMNVWSPDLLLHLLWTVFQRCGFPELKEPVQQVTRSSNMRVYRVPKRGGVSILSLAVENTLESLGKDFEEESQNLMLAINLMEFEIHWYSTLYILCTFIFILNLEMLFRS